MVDVWDGMAWQPSYTYAFSRGAALAGWHQGTVASVNFTTFGTTSPVNVRITNVGGPITALEISPKSKNIVPSLSGNQATFTATTNHKLWLTLNGDDANPLFVFADAPKPAIPSGAKVFGPGVQTVNTFKAVSNQVIYLDGGSWVRGNIDLRGTTGVQIMGPGILSGDLWTAEAIQALPWNQMTAYMMITGDWGGNRASVKGITIVDSPTYNFFGGTASVYNVKLLSPWHWSTDGFQTVPQVDQSFAFVGDNVFFPIWAGVQGMNLSFTNSFVGTSNNAVFCGGFWGNAASNTFSSLADNIDIKTYGDPSLPSVFQVWVDNTSSTNGYRNQTYSNIRIEGNVSERMLQMINVVYPWGTNAAATPLGNSSNFIFKNVSLEGTQPVRSEIKGYDANNGFHNVTFDNLRMGGTLVTPANASNYFDVNGYVSGLNFMGQ
jgi:hypothetical protein